MSVGSDAGADYAAAVSAVRAAVPEQRRGVLADYVVEYGAPFVSFLAGTAPELTGEANEVLASWLSGERVTRRADAALRAWPGEWQDPTRTIPLVPPSRSSCLTVSTRPAA